MSLSQTYQLDQSEPETSLTDLKYQDIGKISWNLITFSLRIIEQGCWAGRQRAFCSIKFIFEPDLDSMIQSDRIAVSLFVDILVEFYKQCNVFGVVSVIGIGISDEWSNVVLKMGLRIEHLMFLITIWWWDEQAGLSNFVTS